MIRTLTAHTNEIDDIELAVNEILSQLEPEKNLLAHSVGLMVCYSEFIESGVQRAICERLPFDVVGSTTFGCADSGEAGLLMLSLTVMTSDDVAFFTAMSESLAEEQEDAIRDAYLRAAAGREERPVMGICYLPLLFNTGGDRLVELLDKASGGVPMFGTTTVDNTSDYRTAYTFLNGNISKDRMALLLIYGNIDPKFQIVSVSDEKIFKQKSVITASNGNILMEVNDMPVIKYLEMLNLSIDGQAVRTNTLQFIVDMNDGSKPVARAIFAFTEDGHAVCGAGMPVGATLSVGAIDYDDVLMTTSDCVKEMLSTGKSDGLIMISCLGRNIALGTDALAEMNLLPALLCEKVPYQFFYSGGEVCPVYDGEGRTVNRFHNHTFTACIY